MLSRLRDYFGLSHRQSRGALWLICIAVGCLLAPFLYRFLSPNQSVDTYATDQRKLDSLLAIMERDDKERAPYKRQYENRSSAEAYTDPAVHRVKLAPFDPNTISVAQLQAFGAPRWLAERIDKYRSKGGQFRKKEDLQRIYGFPPDLYQQLEPYISLSDQSTPANRYTNNKPFSEADNAVGKPAFTNRFEKPKPAPLQPFDINTADTTQLALLKGIGSKLAGRIVKFRDALGGFVSSDQYADIYGLDSLTLAELKAFGRVQSAPKKISINTASAEELDRHVYLSRRQAEIIIRYREQHGAFTSVESLRPIRVLDAKTIEKLAPYLAF